MTFEPDGRILVKSQSRNSGVKAPPAVAAVLSACSQPQSRSTIEANVGLWAGPLFDALVGADLLVPPDQASDTPLMFHNYAGIEVHRRMLQDKNRLNAYWRALQGLIKPEHVVIDAGSGSGVLAIMAALCGARKVYAIEQSEFASSIAAVAEASGVADRVEVVQGDFSKVRLPQKCDVLVTETFGSWCYAEDPCPDVSKCVANNLKPDGIVIPHTITLWLAPMSTCPDPLLSPFKRHDTGLDLSPLVADARGRGHIMATDATAIGPAIQLGGFAFPGHWPIETSFTLQNPCEALCCWFDLDLSTTTSLPTGPNDPPTHWKQSVIAISLPAGEHTLTLAPAPEDRRSLLVTVNGHDIRLR